MKRLSHTPQARFADPFRRQQLILLVLVGLVAQAGAATHMPPADAGGPGTPAAAASVTGGAQTPHPALALVDKAFLEIRSDPEASRKDAEEALRLIEQQPDADLEIRARLVLCDYLS